MNGKGWGMWRSGKYWAFLDAITNPNRLKRYTADSPEVKRMSKRS